MVSLGTWGIAGTNQNKEISGGKKMEIKITSPVFLNEGMVPKKYTCDGENVSPPLSWQNIPANAKSISLICDDPDAPMGTWVHWVIYNIPASIKGLPESVPLLETLTNGGTQGLNDFRKLGYGGPCPPGGTHRYYFKIYALDSVLALSPGVTKQQLLQAMKGHILAEGQLMGKYNR